MKKAFWNLIKSDPQIFDHLIILINEIKDKLKSFTPNRKDTKDELDEIIDDTFLQSSSI